MSAEILLKSALIKLKIIEVPIKVTYLENIQTSSQNPLRHGLTVILTIFKLVIETKPLVSFGIPSLIFFIGSIISSVFVIDFYNTMGRLPLGLTMFTVILVSIGFFLLLTAMILYMLSRILYRVNFATRRNEGLQWITLVKEFNSIIKDKIILVTGGTGSVGQALVEKIIKFGAKKVVIFSNDENGLYEMESDFSNNSKIQYVIGDIRDYDAVSSIVKDIDIIFHAAALKHVDRCESNPFEAVTVNIMGARNIIKSAIYEKVKKVIFISTDKAVNPFGVMGATKLLAEKLISA